MLKLAVINSTRQKEASTKVRLNLQGSLLAMVCSLQIKQRIYMWERSRTSRLKA